MNFAYLKNAPDFAQLYTYCCEAEEFALSKPNISVTSAQGHGVYSQNDLQCCRRRDSGENRL